MEREILIDLNRVKLLQEGPISWFNSLIQVLLGGILSGNKVPFKMRGNKSDMQAFVAALGGEAKYMKTLKKYGLNDPKTIVNRSKLDRSVKNFEQGTGITWPFEG